MENSKDQKIISSPDLDQFKKSNPFIVKMAQIEKEGKISPRELREKFPFEFKIWLQEMYEEMMLGIRSPLILGSSTLTQERQSAEKFKQKKVIELMFALKSKFKTCWKLWQEKVETEEEKLGKKYKNLTHKQKQKSPKPGILTKLYIINEEFPNLFYNKFFDIKQDTILLKISLTLFNTLIRNTNITRTEQKNVHNNTFIKDLKNRLQKTFGKIIEKLKEVEKEQIEQIKNEKHKFQIYQIKQKSSSLELQSELSEPSNILNLAYNFLLFLQIDGYLKPKVADYEDIALLFERNKLEGEDLSGSSPNISILTKKLLPNTSNQKNIDSDAIIRELTKEKAKIMYCPPKNHIKYTNNKLNEPDFQYFGGNLNRGNQITINSLNEWNNYIKDLNLQIKEHKCELGDLTLLALNKLQQTQWEINLDFLRVVAKFKGETDIKIPIKKLTINSFQLEFLPWIKKCMHDLMNRTSSNIESYEAKKDNWERCLEDASKAIRNTGNVFWHAWTAGPRTRLYARSPNLSPNGDDFSKAMIRFKEWKPINERGFYWIKIHLFNHFEGIGNNYFSQPQPHKKSDFDDRVKWIDENREKFQKIAKNPESFKDLLGFTNDIFHKKEVFSRLAILLEYSRILDEFEILMKRKKINYEEITPSERNEILKNIKSGLPIYLDASNNGFQHMAAFTRNPSLADKVNISDTKTQQDLYQEIVNECNKLFSGSDFNKFLEEKELTSSEREEWEKVCFSRKFVKNPTIVFSYGGGISDAIKGKRKKSKSKINKNKSRLGTYNLKWKDPDKEGNIRTKKAIHKQSDFYNLLLENQDNLPKVKELFLINEIPGKKPKTKAIWYIDEKESKKLDDCTNLATFASKIIEEGIKEATANVQEVIKQTFEKILHHDCYETHPLQHHNDWINNSLSNSSRVKINEGINEDNYGISKPYFEWQTIIFPKGEATEKRDSPIIRNIYPRFIKESYSPSAEYFNFKYKGKRSAISSFKKNKEIYYSYTIESLKNLREIIHNKLDGLSSDLEMGFDKEIKEFEEKKMSKSKITDKMRKEKEMWLSPNGRKRRVWRFKIITLIQNLIENKKISLRENEKVEFIFIELLGRLNLNLVYPYTNKKIKAWIKKDLNKRNNIKEKNNLTGKEHCKDLTGEVKKDLKNSEVLYPNPEYLYRGFRSSLIPNIIHSFDATHMQLIITNFINEKENRNDFFAVHDCFGTHACDVDTLKNIIINSFFELYSNLDIKSFIKQIIYNPKNGFGKRIKGENREKIIKEIKVGDFKIENVKNSKFMIN